MSQRTQADDRAEAARIRSRRQQNDRNGRLHKEAKERESLAAAQLANCPHCLAHHLVGESCRCFICNCEMHPKFIRCARVDGKPVALCPNCDDAGKAGFFTGGNGDNGGPPG